MTVEKDRTDKQTDSETPSTNGGVDQLCAAVRMPGYGRTNILFVGWDKNGVPVVSTDKTNLSDQAQISFNITKAVSFPYGRELASLTLQPVEFVGASRPFDRQDVSDDELTEDILTYWVSRGTGGADQIQVPELTMLDAIINGQVIWENFNGNAMNTDEKIPGQNMYTLFFPAENSDKETVLYLMTFRPPMKNESNVSMYRQFLIQTLTTLAKIDQDQPPERRKGYLQAIGLEDGEVETQSGGGLLAVGVLDILRSKFPDFFYLSDSRMNQIRHDSQGKGIADQTKIILREFGLYNAPSAPHSPTELESYSVEALLAVVGVAHDLASRRIKR